jgi:hypothetical protein
MSLTTLRYLCSLPSPPLLIRRICSNPVNFSRCTTMASMTTGRCRGKWDATDRLPSAWRVWLGDHLARYHSRHLSTRRSHTRAPTINARRLLQLTITDSIATASCHRLGHTRRPHPLSLSIICGRGSAASSLMTTWYRVLDQNVTP